MLFNNDNQPTASSINNKLQAAQSLISPQPVPTTLKHQTMVLFFKKTPMTIIANKQINFIVKTYRRTKVEKAKLPNAYISSETIIP